MIYTHPTSKLLLLLNIKYLPESCYLVYYKAYLLLYHKFGFSCFDNYFNITDSLGNFCISFHAFKILKTLFWKGMYKLYQSSKGAHGTVMAF